MSPFNHGSIPIPCLLVSQGWALLCWLVGHCRHADFDSRLPLQLGVVHEWLGRPEKMQYQLVEATAAR